MSDFGSKRQIVVEKMPKKQVCFQIKRVVSLTLHDALEEVTFVAILVTVSQLLKRVLKCPHPLWYKYAFK